MKHVVLILIMKINNELNKSKYIFNNNEYFFYITIFTYKYVYVFKKHVYFLIIGIF